VSERRIPSPILFDVTGFVLAERAYRKLKSGTSNRKEEMDDEAFEKLKKELHFRPRLILALVLLVLSVLLYFVAYFI
jgi:hypothetical protein